MSCCTVPQYRATLRWRSSPAVENQLAMVATKTGGKWTGQRSGTFDGVGVSVTVNLFCTDTDPAYASGYIRVRYGTGVFKIHLPPVPLSCGYAETNWDNLFGRDLAGATLSVVAI